MGRNVCDGRVLKGEVIWKRAWATSSLILLAAYALTFAVTGRLAIPLILISPLYLGFVLANVLKVSYMDVGVQPLDVLRIPEFLPFFHSFFGTEGVVAVIGALGIWLWGLFIMARTSTADVSRAFRCVIGVMAFAVLLALPIAFSQVPVSSSHWLLRELGAPGRGFKEHGRRHGVLLAFLSNLPAAFIPRPHAYSALAVQEASRGRSREKTGRGGTGGAGERGAGDEKRRQARTRAPAEDRQPSDGRPRPGREAPSATARDAGQQRGPDGATGDDDTARAQGRETGGPGAPGAVALRHRAPPLHTHLRLVAQSGRAVLRIADGESAEEWIA